VRVRRSGFSLLEVLIAVAIIGIALVAVIRTQGQGMQLSGEARFSSRAVFLARYVLAQTQSQTTIESGVSNDVFEDAQIKAVWDREITPAPGLPGLFRIQVWVHRPGTPPMSGVTLQGFVYRGEGT
jgi:general secretion pathway protein I